MGTLGWCRGKVYSHTFNAPFAGHVHYGADAAVTKSAVPCLDVRLAGGIESRWTKRSMSDRCRGKGDSIEMVSRG